MDRYSEKMKLLVHQGDSISPKVFTASLEQIFRNAENIESWYKNEWTISATSMICQYYWQLYCSQKSIKRARNTIRTEFGTGKRNEK